MLLLHYQNMDGCFVSARADSSDLFGDQSTPNSKVKFSSVNCRIVKQFPIDVPISRFVDDVMLAFENIDGTDGTFRWFERAEGSGGYIRLLQEIPSNSRIQGL